MIRIVALAVTAAVVAAPALAQIADTSMLSPVPLTDIDWATARVAKKAARLPQELPPPPPPSMATPVVPIAILPPAEPPPPTGPALKREATITGDIVRIGDLVDNAGAVAEVAIFRAPDLGHSGSVSAARVIEAVRQHHILGLDTRGADEVRVTRVARTVGAKDIEAQLIRALVAQHGLADAERLAVSFDGEMRSVHLEPNAELDLARLAYDPRARRFDAVFELPSNSVRRTFLHVSGTLVETSQAVVAARAVATGEVLKATDLRLEQRPKGGEAATAIETLVGTATKHALKPGQPIGLSDVTRPEVVARNGNVTITFEIPGMVLTALGKALDPGMQGDVINVLNVQSKRTIQATVIGPGRVAVAAGPRIPSSAVIASSEPQR
jgi:flagellar basal body P-ring formation protein FlgA